MAIASNNSRNLADNSDFSISIQSKGDINIASNERCNLKLEYLEDTVVKSNNRNGCILCQFSSCSINHECIDSDGRPYRTRESTHFNTSGKLFYHYFIN